MVITPAVQPYGAQFAKDFFKTLKQKKDTGEPVSAWINNVFERSHIIPYTGNPVTYNGNPIEFIFIGENYIYDNK